MMKDNFVDVSCGNYHTMFLNSKILKINNNRYGLGICLWYGIVGVIGNWSPRE